MVPKDEERRECAAMSDSTRKDMWAALTCGLVAALGIALCLAGITIAILSAADAIRDTAACECVEVGQ